MKHLRQYIRQILLESPELQAELEELVFNREGVPYTVGGGSQHREFTKQKIAKHKAVGRKIGYKDTSWPSDEEVDQGVDLRREVKKFWNDNADHSFWQDPSRVLAIHDLGYYTDFYEPGDESSDDFQKDTDLKFSAFFKKYPPGKIQKDEMSTYGFLGMKGFLKRPRRTMAMNLGVILNPRRVTWASNRDSYTESRSEASTEDLIRHASSGLPKRPNVSKTFHGRDAIFDFRDVRSHGIMRELIVDNWSWGIVVLNPDKLSSQQADEILGYARKYNFKVIDSTTGKQLV